LGALLIWYSYTAGPMVSGAEAGIVSEGMTQVIDDLGHPLVIPA